MSGSGFEPAQLKALQQIHKRMLALEKSASDFTGTTSEAEAGRIPKAISEAEVAKVRAALSALLPSDSLEVQKIAEIAKHLRVGMSAKELANWIVPIERALGRQLRDDQFLVYSTDAKASTSEKLPLVFVLDNLRSAFNVGSIFRTAECFGVQKIYLAGYTPAPEQEKVASTAMGTASLVEWEARPKILDLLKELKSQGHRLIAFETTSHAVPVDEPFTEPAHGEGPTAFVFGNERFGLEPALLDLCNEVRKIPLRGTKNSLNVGVATAIATYEFARQYSLGQGAR
jgi:23S rRNA (guanosine2251-2'-O)-methyltransferase